MADETQTPETPAPAPQVVVVQQPAQSSGFDAKVKDWWANNKLLFFIALPLILLFVFRDLIFAMLAGSARKTYQDAQKQDSQLKATADQAAMDAAKAQAEADAAGKQVENRTDDDIPEDWNKRKDPS